MDIFPSETCLLSPRSIPPDIYRRLIFLLSKDNAWEKIAQCFRTVDVFSDEDMLIMKQCPQPAERLISELGSRLCDIGTLCALLEECGLFTALMLFRAHEPLLIINEPFGSGDGNSMMVLRGHVLRLTCVASGLPPPSYQWHCDNAELLGMTHSTLTVANFGLENEGDYYCVVGQEGYQSLVSQIVEVTMAPEHPVIVQELRSQLVCRVGASLVLSVRATGHPELSYQWYKNRKQLDSCTQPDLLIDVATEEEEGTYLCYISNTAGEVWSKPCLITTIVSPEDANLQKNRPVASAKVALLIGNLRYKNMAPLFTPEEDVRTLSELLMSHDFQIFALQNLSLIEMRNAVKEFCKILPKNAYVVFYFAGHGFEMKDKYMLPVCAPGPNSYLKADALSEGELLRDILDTQPQVFLELLDMCRKSPEEENKAIFQEVTAVHEFRANNNLIQGYSTTSHLGAYERRADKNGLFVKFLKPYLMQDISMVTVLANVAKDMEKECAKQMPYRGTNVTKEFRLTDPCGPCEAVKRYVELIYKVPEIQALRLEVSGIEATVTCSPYLGVFCNTLQVTITNLELFKVTCATDDKELELDLNRLGKDLIITVRNVQRLRHPQLLSLELQSRCSDLVENVQWSMGKPMIAVHDLWLDKSGCFTRKS